MVGSKDTRHLHGLATGQIGVDDIPYSVSSSRDHIHFDDITITSGVTSVTATKGSDADNCIGVNRVANRTTCYSVTIGGTVYWGPAGATYYYANGGDTYLTNSLLVYPAP